MKKILFLSLFIAILITTSRASFTMDLFKNDARVTIAAAGASSLLTCWFFHQAAKEWARHPELQDRDSSYAGQQFMKGTTWGSLGTLFTLFTIGIANQNPKVNAYICDTINCLCALKFGGKKVKMAV